MPSADEFVDLFDTRDIIGNESEEPDTSDSDSDNDEDFEMAPSSTDTEIGAEEGESFNEDMCKKVKEVLLMMEA
jgi:hypothetical protein